MIEVQQGGSSGNLAERTFSYLVGLSQSTVIRSMVASRTERKVKARPPSDAFVQKLRDLGLAPERIWWGPMTVHPQRAGVLIDEIERRPPRKVLEVGCGSSSALFAALAHKHDFEVIGLENHQGTIDYVNSMLDGLPMTDRIIIRKCGFVRRRYPNGDRYWWFDADLDRYGDRFDFVFIDGPMGRLVGRNGALPEVMPFIEADCRIYIDDCRRKHERECVAEWQRHYPGTAVEPQFGLGRIRLP